MKISIVIPAYNAEKFVEKCVHSVAEQDLLPTEYEAIVVNDGSTDHTGAILEVLEKQYSFLRYITIANGGVSAARNRGVEEARGEYLLFLDVDDTISSNCLGEIYREMSVNKLDMMLMSYQAVFPDGSCRKAKYRIDRNDHRVVSGREFLLRDNYPPMVYIYAYDRSFFEEHHFLFPCIWHEDEAFTPKAIALARRIKYYPIVFYNYFQNQASFMNTYKEANFYDMISAMSSLNRFKQTCPEDRQLVKYLESRIANRVLMIFKRSIRDGYSIQPQLVQAIVANELFPLKPHKLSFYALLFNLSPSLFEKFYRLLKRK